MRTVTCVCCPRGCSVTVDEAGLIRGNGCRNGAAFALERLSAVPRRFVGTVRLNGAAVERCPVRTDRPVPPERLEDVERALRELEAEAPVYVSQVLLRNVCGTGANVVAAGSIPCKK